VPRAEDSGDTEFRALLEAVGFTADRVLRVWFNKAAGRAISFETVRTRGAEWIAEWIKEGGLGRLV
jgi:hypothetical protein